jgi:hypothetical protein
MYVLIPVSEHQVDWVLAVALSLTPTPTLTLTLTRIACQSGKLRNGSILLTPDMARRLLIRLARVWHRQKAGVGALLIAKPVCETGKKQKSCMASNHFALMMCGSPIPAPSAMYVVSPESAR